MARKRTTNQSTDITLVRPGNRRPRRLGSRQWRTIEMVSDKNLWLKGDIASLVPEDHNGTISKNWDVGTELEIDGTGVVTAVRKKHVRDPQYGIVRITPGVKVRFNQRGLRPGNIEVAVISIGHTGITTRLCDEDVTDKLNNVLYIESARGERFSEDFAKKGDILTVHVPSKQIRTITKVKPEEVKDDKVETVELKETKSPRAPNEGDDVITETVAINHPTPDPVTPSIILPGVTKVRFVVSDGVHYQASHNSVTGVYDVSDPYCLTRIDSMKSGSLKYKTLGVIPRGNDLIQCIMFPVDRVGVMDRPVFRVRECNEEDLLSHLISFAYATDVKLAYGKPAYFIGYKRKIGILGLSEGMSGTCEGLVTGISSEPDLYRVVLDDYPDMSIMVYTKAGFDIGDRIKLDLDRNALCEISKPVPDQKNAVMLDAERRDIPFGKVS